MSRQSLVSHRISLTSLISLESRQSLVSLVSHLLSLVSRLVSLVSRLVSLVPLESEDGLPRSPRDASENGSSVELFRKLEPLKSYPST